MRTWWGLALGALTLAALAGPAAAHFHDGLAVDWHDVVVRLDGDLARAEEGFEVRQATGPFEGRVWARLPAGATVERFGPIGAEVGPAGLVQEGGGLVGYDLAANGRRLDGTAIVMLLRWHAPLPGDGTLVRGIVYATDNLRVHAEAPLTATPGEDPHTARFGAEVHVHRGPAFPLEGWVALVAVAVALLAGAWFWDRRAGGKLHPGEPPSAGPRRPGP